MNKNIYSNWSPN